ncbi:MAG: DUF4394 domain-containing protein [Fluviicola sp.]
MSNKHLHLSKILSKLSRFGLVLSISMGGAKAFAQTSYGISSNNLVSFNISTPGSVSTVGTFSGLISGQTIVGLDFRPATGELYALGYNAATGAGRLYKINLTSALATPVGAADFMLDAGETVFGFDFNPTVDRIRLITSTDNNYRLHPVTGAIAATDGTIAFNATDVNSASDAMVLGSAYTNSYIGATSTALYNIEGTTSSLVLQNPPNNGTLNTIGSLGVSASNMSPDMVDMDIFYNPMTAVNTAFLINPNGMNQTVYSLNLTTGATSMIGTTGAPISDFAVQINFNPPAAISGQLVYGLTANNYIISFDSGMPSTVRTHVPVSGLTAGQVLVGVDSRPATGQLYGMGYNSTNGETQLYTINPASGAASSIASPITLAVGMTQISFDFNPTVDRIRVTSLEEHNYRLHPVTGALVVADGNLSYNATDANNGANPGIAAGAYTNSYIGGTATQLFNYDITLNLVTLQNPPNNGTLNSIGNSGIMVNVADPSIDFDFFFNPASGMNETYSIANTATNFDNLYTVNLTTGAFTLVGQVGNGIALTDMAVQIIPNMPMMISGELVYGLTSNQYLISFDSESPDVVRTHLPITGINAGQMISGLDVRPATGELYALGYNTASGESQLYTINPMTGAVTSVAPAITLATGMANIGFDFNPTVDRIRVVSSSGNNYRLHPTTGAIAATDINLAYASGDANMGATPSIGSGAYTNSYGGSNNTKLFVYDDILNVLALQNPPNNGVLNTIGTSGITQSMMDMSSDLDIYYNHTTHTNHAYLISNTSNSFDSFYVLNTATGAVTSVGLIGNGIALRDIAVRNDSITSISSSSSMISPVACMSYTAPDNMMYTLSGTYTAIIPNALGYDSLITINLTVNMVDNSVSLMNDTTLTAAETGGMYQWINCATNMPVSGATSQSFTPMTNGNYAVIVTSAAGCADTSTCTAISVLGIDEASSFDFSIAPNPSTGIFQVTLIGTENQVIRVLDAMGRTILEQETQGNQASIDLSSVNSGVYYVSTGNTIKQVIKY